MAKSTAKKINWDLIVSENAINDRLEDNYDLEALLPQLLSTGRVLVPLAVEIHPTLSGKYLSLQGNRRIRCVQRIMTDPSIPDDVKAGFQKLECNLWEGLTETERERLIHDKGGAKGLNREEVVRAVWRLAKQFRSTREIGELMFTQLGQMGDQKKLNTIPTDPAKRAEYLATWFRGTLDQFILYGCTMGEYIKTQFLLTQRKLDGRLKEGDGWELDCTRKRITALNKAKNFDNSADGKGWTAENGGETFNVLIERYKAEDKGTATDDDSAKRLKDSDIEKRIEMMQSPEIKDALRSTLGNKEAARNLPALDEMLTRSSMVREILTKSFDKLDGPEIKEFVRSLLSTGPAAEVESALKPFIASPADPAPAPDAPPAE